MTLTFYQFCWKLYHLPFQEQNKDILSLDLLVEDNRRGQFYHFDHNCDDQICSCCLVMSAPSEVEVWGFEVYELL